MIATVLALALPRGLRWFRDRIQIGSARGFADESKLCMNRFLPLTALWCSVVIGGCATHRVPPVNADRFAVDTRFGTLALRGVIERRDLGNRVEYRPKLVVTFHPHERVNHTSVIRIRAYRLAATTVTARSVRAEVRHEHSKPIKVDLTRPAQQKSLPEVVFVVPKSTLEQVNHVGLSVTDGKWLWPVSVELR